MRFVTTLLLGTALALPAMAQTTPTPPNKPHHATRHAPARHGAMNTRATAEDKGPFTPEANRAYQGGGVVMEGAPGGSAPAPMTPMR